MGIMGRTEDYGYYREPGYKPLHTQVTQFTQYTQYTQYTQFTRTLSLPSLPIITKKAQSDGLQWVTISYYEQSDIINKTS